MRWIFGIIVLLVLIAVGGMLALPSIISNDAVKAKLTKAFESSTGRELTIEGDIGLSYWPSLQVQVEDVRLSNAPWGKEPHMLTARTLGAELALLPLLKQQVEIIGVHLIQPAIVLETRADGATNWQFAKAHASYEIASAGSTPAKSKLKSLVLESMSIQQGTVTLINHADGSRQTLKDIDANASLPNMQEALQANISARWNDEPITLQLRASPGQALLDGQATEAKLTLQAPSLKASFDGQLTTQPGDPQRAAFDGPVSLHVEELEELLAWLQGDKEGEGAGVEMLEEIALNGSLTGDIMHPTIKNLQLKLDHLRLQGELGAELGGKAPAILARLHSNDLNLTPFLEEVEEEHEEKEVSFLSLLSTAHAATGAPVSDRWSETPLPFDGLHAVELALTLTADKVQAKQFEGRDLNLSADINGGILQAALKELKLYQGTAKGKASVIASSPPKVTQSLTLENVQLEPLLTSLDLTDRITGKAKLEWAIQTQGRSPRSLISNLSGNGSFLANEGVIRGLNLAKMIRAAREQEGEEEGAETRFTKLSASFTANNGTIHNPDMLLESPVMNVKGHGNILLPPWLIDYRLEPQWVKNTEAQEGEAKKPLKLDFKVTGPLDKPRFRPALSSIAKDALKDPEAAKETLKSLQDGLKGLLGR